MDTHINDIIRPVVPLERNHAARERIGCVLTAGGVRALQKLGRYIDIERGSYLVVKLPLEAMDRAADLRQDSEEAYTIPARRRVATYSRGIHGWDFLPSAEGFFCPKICSSLHGPIRGTESGMK